MSKVWLHIIGLDESEIVEFSLLESAKNILGTKRLLDRLPKKYQQKTQLFKTPFKALIEQVLALRGEQIIILASGDANWFGIGASLISHLDFDEYETYPSLSAFQLAASKLHWALQNTDCISLHGRSVGRKVENLHKYLFPKNRILALTSDKNTLYEVASLLEQRGYENSSLNILENLGAKNERIISFKAHEAIRQKIGDFYVLAIDCVANESAPLLPNIAGLPDEAYICDGQLTKREVRAITLAKLAPYPNAILWDIGAGCGSIGIEFMRSARNAKAICFERNEKRIAYIEQNKLALGVPDLEIIAGEALENITDQIQPDVIFLGGEVANVALLESCLRALKIGGRIVANAVSLGGQQALLERYKNYGGELIKIDIARAKQNGKISLFEPKKTIMQWSFIKGQK